jgi:hypothetical protein
MVVICSCKMAYVWIMVSLCNCSCLSMPNPSITWHFMNLLASHRFTSSNNYLASTLYIYCMAKLAQQQVLGQRRPGPARRGDAGEPMQLACQHEVLAQLKLSYRGERCLEWWLGWEVLVMSRSLAGSTAKHSSNPAKSKDWISLFKVHQTQSWLGNDDGTEPHWIPVARNLQIASLS